MNLQGKWQTFRIKQSTNAVRHQSIKDPLHDQTITNCFQLFCTRVQMHLVKSHCWIYGSVHVSTMRSFASSAREENTSSLQKLILQEINAVTLISANRGSQSVSAQLPSHHVVKDVWNEVITKFLGPFMCACHKHTDGLQAVQQILCQRLRPACHTAQHISSQPFLRCER